MKRRKQRSERLIRIPTGVVTVPAPKIRTFYSQYCEAEQFLAKRRSKRGTKESK